MADDILDYSDLGKPIIFKFNNDQYEIPAPTNKKSKELMRMGRKISNDAKINERRLSEYEGKEDQIPQELMDDMDKLFDFQIDFIINAGIVKIKGEKKNEAKKEELVDNWPNKLVNRVFRKINEMFNEDEQEKKL